MLLARAKQRGFTLLEILVVLAIMSIIVTLIVSAFQNYARFQRYNQAVGDVLFSLQQAQLSARSAVDDENHGVKILSNSIVQFTGDAYVSGDPDNITTLIPLVTITPNLSDAGDEVVFEKLTGLPRVTGTITVTGDLASQVEDIEVTAAGVVQ